MTSFIIITKNEEKGRAEVVKICDTHAIDELDRSYVLPIQKKEGPATSLGISDVKLMQQKISLKPIKSKTKAVILPNAQLLTIPAQNALLKLLEEPPDNTLLILITTSIDALLPTIRSRCSILKMTSESKVHSDEEKKQLLHQATLLTTQPPGDALKMAEQLAKDKQKAVAWIEDTMMIIRNQMITDVEEKKSPTTLATSLRLLQQAHRDITTTNANPRLLLESLFLTIQAHSSK